MGKISTEDKAFNAIVDEYSAHCLGGVMIVVSTNGDDV